jgi:hypothetical protein
MAQHGIPGSETLSVLDKSRMMGSELDSYGSAWDSKPRKNYCMLFMLRYNTKVLIVVECILLLYVISKILTLIPYSQLVLCVYTYTRFITLSLITICFGCTEPSSGELNTIH